MIPDLTTPHRPRRSPVRLAAALAAVAVLAVVTGAAPAGTGAPAAARSAQAPAGSGAPAGPGGADGAEAPPRTTWGISPAGADGRDRRSTIEHVVAPGEVVEDHVVIDNYGDEPLTVVLYAADARPADGAFDVTAMDERDREVGAWTALGRELVEIPARGEVVVPVTIRVPDDATPGDHAGGILAARRSSAEGGGVGFETERRVGTRVHLRVAGAVRSELTVTDLHAAAGGWWQPARDLTVRYTVRNTGNLRLSGAVAVTVTGPFGLAERTVRGEPIEDLLPGHATTGEVRLPGVVALGRHRVTVTVTPTASADQAVTGSVPVATRSTTLWLVPVLIPVVAAILVGVTFRRYRRRRRSRRSRGEPGPAEPAAPTGPDGPAASTGPDGPGAEPAEEPAADDPGDAAPG